MKTRVLIVDDERMIRENLMAYLEDEGLPVADAASVEAALWRVATEPDIAVCIMDLRLPDMDGHSGIRRLHELDPGLQFIIHTGSTDYLLPPDLRALGLDESRLFYKPLSDMAPLARLARRLCEASRP